VLRRARFDVENRETRLKLHRDRRAYSEQFEEAPRLEALQRDLRAKEAALERARADAELDGRSRRLAAERGRRSLREKENQLSRLAEDLEGMVVRAPASGMLLHGPARGSLGRRFDVGHQVNPVEPVITVVESAEVSAVFTLPAGRRLELQPGLSVVARPAPEGAGELEGKVHRIAPFPSGGEYRVEVRLDPPPPFELAGTEVKGTVLLRRLHDVLLVPLDLVLREGGQTFCLVVGEDGPRKVRVELGPRGETHVAVRDGLAEGDRLAAPEDAR
jgi:multidrug efflux pump subunit AcrA (membrane-fusion protein)